jgi:hypothetical protein
MTYTLDSYDSSSFFRPSKFSFGVSLNTNFAKAQVRVARKLGGATISIEAGIDKDMTPDEMGTIMYSRAMLSTRLLHSFKAYFG